MPDKGKGAFLNESPIRVSSMERFGDSLIATCFPFRKKEVIEFF
jgi:fructose-1,6-bisphosphatase/inositol monophosphatase family enzyme